MRDREVRRDGGKEKGSRREGKGKIETLEDITLNGISSNLSPQISGNPAIAEEERDGLGETEGVEAIRRIRSSRATEQSSCELTESKAVSRANMPLDWKFCIYILYLYFKYLYDTPECVYEWISDFSAFFWASFFFFFFYVVLSSPTLA